jgi:hypothetical protein
MAVAPGTGRLLVDLCDLPAALRSLGLHGRELVVPVWSSVFTRCYSVASIALLSAHLLCDCTIGPKVPLSGTFVAPTSS